MFIKKKKVYAFLKHYKLAQKNFRRSFSSCNYSLQESGDKKIQTDLYLPAKKDEFPWNVGSRVDTFLNL